MDQASHTQPSWLDMTASDFDTDPRPVQGALFAAPDPLGTADMFGDQQ